MSSSRRSSETNMGMSIDPVVPYYDPLIGIAPGHLLSHHVAFASDMNGYQVPSIVAEPIGRFTHPSHGTCFNASAFNNLPANGSSREPPRGHVCHSGQVHRDVQEKDTSDEPSRPYKCGWIGCTNTEGFKRPACLWRHVKSLHICPGEFQCPHCRRKFNRNDKLKAHIQTVHAKKGHSGVSTCDGSRH